MLSPVWQVMLLDAAIGLGLISLAYWPRFRWGVLWVAMLAFPVLICTKVTTGLVMFSLLVGMWATVWRRVPGWVAVGLNLLLLAFVLPCNFSVLQSGAVRMKEWRAQHPRMSLESRLAYEEPHRPVESQGIETSPRTDEPEMTMVLNGSDRARILMELHQGTYDYFVTSPGFGVARIQATLQAMSWIPSLDTTKLPEPRPEPPAYPQDHEPGGVPLAPRSESAPRFEPPQLPPPENTLGDSRGMLDFHRQAKSSFLDPRGWGYVRNQREVIGFAPHAMRQHSKFSLEMHSDVDGVWRLSRLELMSLLRHERPRVYVSRKLPNMERLEDVPTRELDRFEAAALPRLEGGEPIVIHSDVNTTRMLGAIVAGKACLQCHTVPEDFLLGAFSYQLDRRVPLPERPPEGLPVQ